MAIEVLAATTSAETSISFSCDGINPVTVIMHAAAGLTNGAEYGDLQISHDGGVTFQDLFEDDGTGTGVQRRLHGGVVTMTIYGPGVFRVDKEVTSNAAGISLSSHSDSTVAGLSAGLSPSH